MDKEREESQIWSVWIHREQRVVSFREAEGFERLEYPTHDEMFDFAIQKTREGFALQ